MIEVPSSPKPRAGVLRGSSVRFGATLVVALVATKPGFEHAFSEGASLTGALGRFLLAFAVFWLAGGVAAVVLHREAVEPDMVASVDMVEMVPGSAGTDR